MEESGWKMVAGDVFRPPRDVTLLCVQVGSGIQITASFFITLFFAALGAPRPVLACPTYPPLVTARVSGGGLLQRRAAAYVRAALVAQASSKNLTVRGLEWRLCLYPAPDQAP